MMILDKIPIREISTLAILVPLIISARYFIVTGIHIRLFFIFLLLGFLTDLLGWYVSYSPEEINYLLLASLIYSYCEAVFFVWLVTDYSPSNTIKKLRIMILTGIAIWIGFTIFNGSSVQGNISYSALFDTSYQIAISFLAGFALLKMAEKEDQIVAVPMFWILCGVFFYCFSTFFIFIIKSRLNQDLANRLWPVHNLVNIFTYLLYSIGLWKYRGINKV